MDMPKLAIVATIEITPGRMDEFLPLLMAHKARCLRDEPGTLQFDVLVPRDDNSKVLIYEVYQDGLHPVSEDTELRCLMEQEADHGEASEVHTRVQA
jgi:Antibiotic biosynthesis monooxygenase